MSEGGRKTAVTFSRQTLGKGLPVRSNIIYETVYYNVQFLKHYKIDCYLRNIYVYHAN